jgi:phage tail-like protein
MSTQQLLSQAHAAFRFVVEIAGEKEAVFTECTLPVVELEIEEVKEGGLNEFIHQLPGHRKSARLTLKSGVGKSSLVTWCNETMAGKFKTKTVTIRLLDTQKSVVASWDILNAYPIKWTGPSLKSDDNSVAIQTLELACGQISVTL